ncbi:MAG: SdrD B-like domain-containing protein [Thermoguttaceae bacterium]
MGLFGRPRNSRRARKARQAGHRIGRARTCRFEQVEPRQLLSFAPIQIGAVYFEDATEDDQAGDVFEVTFNGGAPGTQLAELAIELDKLRDGLSLGDCLFDTAPGGLGAYQSQPLVLLEHHGIDAVRLAVDDGSQVLRFQFSGFDPGEKLVFSIDVDEMGFLGPNAVAEGNELEGSRLMARFIAPHCYDASGGDMFVDYYDAGLAASGLLLPPDSYVPPGTVPRPVLTAGAIFSLVQQPLPVSIAGTVFEDLNGDNTQQPGDPGLENVRLELWRLEGEQYLWTGKTALTGPDGSYQFEDLLPGTYRVVETQPAGYLSTGARAGTVDGQTRGAVLSPDVLSDIELLGGEHSVQNDFAEARPATLSGRVAADSNENGQYDPGEKPLAGVSVQLLDASGQVIASTRTDAQGQYVFSGLMPGVYGLREIQPAGYYDGCEQVGSAGGALKPPDSIVQITLMSAAYGVEYNFLELEPASICGYVFQDGPTITYQSGTPPPDPLQLRDGRFTPDDTPIPGVTIRLADAFGQPLFDSQASPMTAITNADGYYEFTGLRPGMYTIIETHPAGYVDGLDTAGSKGGIAVNLGTELDAAIASQLTFDTRSDAILRVPLGPGDCAKGYNFSEIKMEEVPAPPPPPAPLPPLPPTPPWSPLPPPTPMPFWPEPVPFMPLVEPGTLREILSPSFGGGGIPFGSTWHLSVINAGRPREDLQGAAYLAEAPTAPFNPVSWSGPTLNQMVWILADANGLPAETCLFGPANSIPVVGDWDGDGIDQIGVFIDGTWLLDLDANGQWSDEDLWARLGDASDRPLTGDWDGDGKTDIGIFGPVWPGDHRAIQLEPGLPDAANRADSRLVQRYKNIPPDPHQAPAGYRTLKRTALGKFRKDLIDHVFQYGLEQDLPVAGDWNGDGVTNIGVFRNGTWYLDADGNGRWSAEDISVELGQPGDIPVVGDWNGDGKTELGVYRNGTWYLDSNGDRLLDARDHVLQLGQPGDLPVVGDWDGDGMDQIGVARPAGPDSPRPVAQNPQPARLSAALHPR